MAVAFYPHFAEAEEIKDQVTRLVSVKVIYNNGKKKHRLKLNFESVSTISGR